MSSSNLTTKKGEKKQKLKKKTKLSKAKKHQNKTTKLLNKKRFKKNQWFFFKTLRSKLQLAHGRRGGEYNTPTSTRQIVSNNNTRQRTNNNNTREGEMNT